MKNTLIVKASFAILVLLNLVLIFLLVAKPAGPGMPGRNDNMGKVIVEKLNFDEAQRLEFELSAKKHSKEMMKLNQQQMKAMKDYFTLLKSDIIDPHEKSASLEKLKQIESDKVSITFIHFEELKSICNEDQLANFQEVVDHVIPMLLGNSKNNLRPPRDK